MRSQFQNIHQITTKATMNLETIITQINPDELDLMEKALLKNVKIAVTFLQEVNRELQQRCNLTYKENENGTN